MMLAQQVPQPPLPPGSELTLAGSLNDLAAVVLLLGAGLIVAALIWPLIRALPAGSRVARRAPRCRPRWTLCVNGSASSRRWRRAWRSWRRLDFAERIVAKSHEPDRIQR